MIAWGTSYYSGGPPPPPAGLGYVAIAAGLYHNAALLSDGNVVAWGLNADGQCNVSPPPPALSYTAVAAGTNYTIVRRSDGRRPASAAAGKAEQASPPPRAPDLPTRKSKGAAHSSSDASRRRRRRQLVGSGCGGAGSPHSPATRPPRATPRSRAGAGSTPGASGFLYSSGIPAAPIALGSGCTAAVDLASFAPFTPVAADPTGSWGLTLGVPPDTGLVGVQFALQIALFPTAGPLGLDLSNGLHITVGY